MEGSKKKNLVTFTFVITLIMALTLLIMMMLGPVIGNVFSTINSSLVSVETPSGVDVHPSGLEAELAQIDQALQQSLQASLAYNAPASMRLGETVAVELLISPSVSEQELGEQITEGGEVATSTIEVTPRMKVELKAAEKDAFEIEPVHDSPEQLLSAMEPTKWSWWVTAEKSGVQHLTLVVYRMIKYDEQEYWREVETYRADIEVKVTLGQRLLMLDWKWILGILLTAILIPAFWRWIDKKKKEAEKIRDNLPGEKS